MSDPIAPAALVVNALNMVRADSSIRSNLSAESTLVLDALGGSISAAMGGADLVGILSQVSTQVLTTVVEAALKPLSAASDIVGAIPIIGQVIGLALSAISNSAEQAAQAKKIGDELRQQLAHEAIQPIPSGRDRAVPADIFAPQFYQWYDVAAKRLWPQTKAAVSGAARCLLGSALIKCTEAGLQFEGDRYAGVEYGLHRERLPKGFANPFFDDFYWVENAELAIAAVRKELKNQTLGVPKKRAEAFRALRKAIEAQWRPAQRGSSNGGVALWPVYLDLLVMAFKEGQLSREYCRKILSATVSRERPSQAHYKDGSNPKVHFSDNIYAHVGAYAIHGMVDNWERQTQPFYAQDRAPGELETSKRVARMLTMKNLGKPIPASELAAVPAEVAQKAGLLVQPSKPQAVQTSSSTAQVPPMPLIAAAALAMWWLSQRR